MIANAIFSLAHRSRVATQEESIRSFKPTAGSRSLHPHAFGRRLNLGVSCQMAFLAFAFGIMTASMATAVVSVYIFGVYEPAWGGGASLQVLMYFAFAAAFVGTSCFAIGGLVLKRFPSRTLSFLLGCAVTSASIAIGIFTERHNFAAPGLILSLCFIIASVLAPAVPPRAS